jgi:hypothetical protein
LVKIGDLDIPDTILIAAVSLAAGIIGTYLSAILKFRNDLRAKYDEHLRNMRIESYKKLWEMTEPFARYSPPGPVTYHDLKDISSNMRKWYFKTGGWLLSDNCRNSYFYFQKEIKETLKNELKVSIRDQDSLPETTLEKLRDASSVLRTNICKDIGTRARPAFDYD